MNRQRALGALTRRELIRFVREPTRVATTIGVPLVLWLLAGSGFASSFVMPGAGDDGSTSYAQFVLPGIVTAVVLFSTIFASISLIQDRQTGFLQSVLVSPAPAWSIAGSKVLGGTIMTSIQALIVLASSLAIGLHPGFIGFVLSAVAVALTSAALISMGLALAWWVNSTAGYHGIMNAILMPMWMLSGALFPVDGASSWLATLVRFNPMHWCTRTIAGPLGIGSVDRLDWLGTVGFAIVTFAFAQAVMTRGSGNKRNAQVAGA